MYNKDNSVIEVRKIQVICVKTHKNARQRQSLSRRET